MRIGSVEGCRCQKSLKATGVCSVVAVSCDEVCVHFFNQSFHR